MLKYILKISAIYLAAFGVGIGLFFLLRPYAAANRFDATGVGGEVLLPIAVPFLTLCARCVFHDAKDGRFKLEVDDDE